MTTISPDCVCVSPEHSQWLCHELVAPTCDEICSCCSHLPAPYLPFIIIGMIVRRETKTVSLESFRLLVLKSKATSIYNYNNNTFNTNKQNNTLIFVNKLIF